MPVCHSYLQANAFQLSIRSESTIIAFTDFEGLSIKQEDIDGEQKLIIIVGNDIRVWKRTIDAVIGRWFDLVIGWSKTDGIAIKVDNKKVAQTKVSLSDIFYSPIGRFSPQ